MVASFKVANILLLQIPDAVDEYHWKFNSKLPWPMDNFGAVI